MPLVSSSWVRGLTLQYVLHVWSTKMELIGDMSVERRQMLKAWGYNDMCHKKVREAILKIDRVGTVDNRPSTD